MDLLRHELELRRRSLCWLHRAGMRSSIRAHVGDGRSGRLHVDRFMPFAAQCYRRLGLPALRHAKLMFRPFPWSTLVKLGANGNAATPYGRALMREMRIDYRNQECCERSSLRVWYIERMDEMVRIIGGGLAGSEAALALASLGVRVQLCEMRPSTPTPVHRGGDMAELVCSNSLKSLKAESAAGMLKAELEALGSHLLAAAHETSVEAGGALAVDRTAFAARVTQMIEDEPLISVERGEVRSLAQASEGCAALLLATGPLTSDALAADLQRLTGSEHLAFYDAAAPIVMADSVDGARAFRQSRYEGEPGTGDYLNCPFTKGEYERFIAELVAAERVMKRDFERGELFQACQPIEEIARKGADAPRFGPMKPVGLTDPATGRRPWAAVQLRAEDAQGQSYNLVGFQTNLTFPEQRRVFRMIPGLEEAEFARFGVMHRNTYLDCPRVLLPSGRLVAQLAAQAPVPTFVAGQLAGTEGYCEAMRSGLNAAIGLAAELRGVTAPEVPPTTAFGALLAYATDPDVVDYQPMHVNFSIVPPLEARPRNKRERYAAYAERGERALRSYRDRLAALELLPRVMGKR